MPHKGICQIVNALMCGWNISPIQKQSALGSEPDLSWTGHWISKHSVTLTFLGEVANMTIDMESVIK